MARFYQETYPDGSGVFYENFGHLLRTVGVIVQGAGKTLFLLGPNGDEAQVESAILHEPALYQPTLEQWRELIEHMDDPKYWGEDKEAPTYIHKIFHRKFRMLISGAVQQRIWVRDKWRCMYCGKRSPEVVLSVDHFIPLELGGVNDTSNYITACKRCNKDKGAMHPKDWCEAQSLDYEALCDYLKGNLSARWISHL